MSSALIRTNSFLLCDPATSLPLVSIETNTQKHNHMNLQNPLQKQLFSIFVISYKTQRTQLCIKHTHTHTRSETHHRKKPPHITIHSTQTMSETEENIETLMEGSVGASK